MARNASVIATTFINGLSVFAGRDILSIKDVPATKSIVAKIRRNGRVLTRDIPYSQVLQYSVGSDDKFTGAYLFAFGIDHLKSVEGELTRGDGYSIITDSDEVEHIFFHNSRNPESGFVNISEAGETEKKTRSKAGEAEEDDDGFGDDSEVEEDAEEDDGFGDDEEAEGDDLFADDGEYGEDAEEDDDFGDDEEAEEDDGFEEVAPRRKRGSKRPVKSGARGRAAKRSRRSTEDVPVRRKKRRPVREERQTRGAKRGAKRTNTAPSKRGAKAARGAKRPAKRSAKKSRVSASW